MRARGELEEETKETILRLLHDLDPLRKVKFFVQKVQNVNVILAQHIDQVGDRGRVRADLHTGAALSISMKTGGRTLMT